MAEVIEAMARAMCIDGGFDPDVGLFGPCWRYYVPSARAALAAMLEAVGEPTQEMREAFVELALRVSLSREYTWGDYANDQWKVMLAASPLYSLAALREEV